MSKIVLATFGSHGDVNPFISLALALRARGFAPVIAAAPRYQAKVEGAGVGFCAVGPQIAEYAADLGMSLEELGARLGREPRFLLTRIIFPYLQRFYRDIEHCGQDAALLVTHSGSYAGKLVAEKHGLPHFGIALHPSLFLSTYDPSVVAAEPHLSRLVYGCGAVLTRAYFRRIKRITQSWIAPLLDMRRKLGLPEPDGHPLYEGQFCGDGTLGLYSPLIGRVQPDYPARTTVVGFTFYDADQVHAEQHARELNAFLAAGPRPLVFTLGTAGIYDTASFMQASLAAVTRLGQRAIFVLEEANRQRWAHAASERVMICGYAPFSRLFARAAAVIHHGGIGTTAQALRSGRPQLITPYMMDQPDNAARAARLGVGRVLLFKSYSEARATRALHDLLSSAEYERRAAEIARDLTREEDGAVVAARMIEQRLGAARAVSASLPPRRAGAA